MARDYYDRDRNMWERSRDEVRSWFGDEDAEHRRMQDQRQAEWEEQSRMRGNPYRSVDHRQEMADAEFDRDWDLDDRANYGPFRNDPPFLGDRGDRGRWQRRGSQRHPGRRPNHGDHRNYGGDYRTDYHYGQVGGSTDDFTGLGPSGYRRSDERIREDISEALTWDRQVDASGIVVEVSEGVATLSGTVRDRRMKRRAEDLAEGVRGISDVNNHLGVGQQSTATGDQADGLR